MLQNSRDSRIVGLSKGHNGGVFFLFVVTASDNRPGSWWDANSLASLLAFCRSQARIERNDYFNPCCCKPEEVQAWRSDCAKRDRARKLCFSAFPGRLKSAASEALVLGNYGFQGRLSILSDGVFDYTSNQYAPAEIYQAFLSYLEATN